RLLGNGVDLRRFTDVAPEARDRVRRALGIADGTVVVGTVGRITHEKGFGELVGAAARVRASRDDVRFLVVGAADPGGVDEAVLADAAGHVDLLGWRTDVPEVLSAMDVFLLASWRGGGPRAGRAWRGGRGCRCPGRTPAGAGGSARAGGGPARGGTRWFGPKRSGACPGRAARGVPSATPGAAGPSSGSTSRTCATSS